ncbi:MAG: hypothetical protein AAF356_12480 [Planctomycetota bacterium]
MDDRRLPLAAIVLLGAIAWTGCGPNGSIGLPNGYALHVLNADDTVIGSPEGLLVGIHDASVWEFGVHREVVYGTYRSPSAEYPYGDPLGYFLIDTSTHEIEHFEVRERWEAALIRRGERSIKLHWPSLGPFNPLLWERPGPWIRGAIALGVVAASIWLWRRIRTVRCRDDGVGLI